jgi:hypothetical protein
MRADLFQQYCAFHDQPKLSTTSDFRSRPPGFKSEIVSKRGLGSKTEIVQLGVTSAVQPFLVLVTTARSNFSLQQWCSGASIHHLAESMRSSELPESQAACSLCSQRLLPSLLS